MTVSDGVDDEVPRRDRRREPFRAFRRGPDDDGIEPHGWPLLKLESARSIRAALFRPLGKPGLVFEERSRDRLSDRTEGIGPVTPIDPRAG